MNMKTGKLPETILRRSVLKLVGHRIEEVLAGPAVGVDCAAVQAQEDGIFVLSSDPITATSMDMGSQCIHITANDLAASGAEPLGVMLTVLLPPGTEETDLREMMQDCEQTCASLNMEILGGHTEITDAVTRPVISVTGIGKLPAGHLLAPSDIHPGEDIIVTKWIGLEATSILAKEREEELLQRFSPGFLREAREFDRYLSVVQDAAAAVRAGATAMHDVTEGGIFGALWEIAEAGGVGLEADIRAIPIRQETVEICEYFRVNPYQIMSSGSLLIAAPDGTAVVNALRGQGIEAAVIGHTTEGPARILRNGGEVRYLDKPQRDELYKVLSQNV